MWQGAVESLLERSTCVQLLDGTVVLLDDGLKNLILNALSEMSTNALRCLGFAYKEDLAEFATYDSEDHPAHKLLLDPSNYSAIETGLIFVGLVGLRVRYLAQLGILPSVFLYILFSYSADLHAYYILILVRL